ncbi:hypothetical protein Wildcat_21 [Mycobacterium phage Wildcat]|uniref:Uncharacterized protein n=2 Tax=Mycobacterium virus Wildcat TaxID=1993859 RepID=Q19Y39_9CAUD|nr:hypothetical protein Wildcat_21 [Mycobacterium phage Wildcat]ABE67626.1 hypothetical protein Wildcat_21 [Mycobacterium phage Wildcat]QGJ89911.1 hypothetical protein PBI_MARYV_21 [Mycobacterium phage MaryV]
MNGSWVPTELPKLPEGYRWEISVQPDRTLIAIIHHGSANTLFVSEYRQDSYAATAAGWKRGVVHRAYGLLAHLETYLEAKGWVKDLL